MKFRTEIQFPPSEKKIKLSSSIFTLGSCFASEISARLKMGQLQNLHNPFGTLFNPYAVNQALSKIYRSELYTEQDLIKYNDYFISLDHHSSFNSRFTHQTLSKINQNIQESNDFLQRTDLVIITLGTAFIYEFLPKKKLVANCHKIPARYFSKRLLSHEELRENLLSIISILQDICPAGVTILFSISPVRHIKDGLVENQLSKSKLIVALHEVISKTQNTNYLPVYETLMDDLRDYRFYKEDLIHPTEQAVEYVWEKFRTAYFSPETSDFVLENFKIVQALQHRASDEKDPNFLKFKEKIKIKIGQQQAKVKHQIF